MKKMEFLPSVSELASIPVIAFTASAMQEDRDICLSAGCDDFLSKPIQAENLLSKLKFFLTKSGHIEGSDGPTPENGPESTTSNDQAISEDPGPDPHDQCEVTEGETAVEIEDIMSGLREEYMALFHETVEEFEKLLSSKDLEGLTDLGHRIKGNSTCYGFPQISSVGAEIEKLGKAGNLDDIPPQIDLLREIQEGFQEKTTT